MGPALMGIVNVTPDSFSDGGAHAAPEAAIAHGQRLLEDGAAILDIGGESTRPGAEPVTVEEELRRVLPVVEAFAAEHAPVSIDTRNARVMRAAADAGATIFNDVSALSHDPDSLAAATDTGALVVLMHMQGEPATMNDDPRYEDVVQEVYAYLAGRIETCVAAGIPRERIAIDPGLGFGKAFAHNMALLGALDRFLTLGCTLLVGASRKLTRHRASPGEKLASSIAAALRATEAGAGVLRVHDVAETRTALSIWRRTG